MTNAHHSRWHDFRRSRPGRRFQDAHARHLENELRVQGLRRWLLIGLGFLLTVGGVVLLAFPGPGLLVALIGVSLIAREFLSVACLLDRAELALRPASLRARRWWRRTVRPRPWILWLITAATVVGMAVALVIGWRLLR